MDWYVFYNFFFRKIFLKASITFEPLQPTFWWFVSNDPGILEKKTAKLKLKLKSIQKKKYL